MENEKRLMDAYLSGEVTKIKTPFAEIIVSGAAEKPYYSIMFFDPAYKEYEVCFGSYCLEYVRKWLSEEFEIVDAPTVDAVEVVRCKDCSRRYDHDECPMCHLIDGEYNDYTFGDGFCDRGERRDDEGKAD